MLSNEDLLQLQDRISQEHLGKRLELQAQHSALRFSPSGLHLYWENLDLLAPLLKVSLKVCGMFHRATRNATEYEVTAVTAPLRRLPSSFHGFRILHLSDLHLEGMFDRGWKLKEVLRSLTYDLCVITGDFRYLTYGDYHETVARMTELTNAIDCPHGTIAVLGNHDFIEMVPPLEKMGLQMLLNEAVPIRRGDDTIWIAGVDDPHYYETHDLSRALQSVPSEGLKILLAHSPEIIPEACEAGIDFYLCGHSHGGQICLPGQVPIINNSHCGREFISGPWSYQDRMVGFTSRGTGNSLLPVRFNCPPEITLHQLV